MLYAGFRNDRRFPSAQLYPLTVAFLWGIGLLLGLFYAEQIPRDCFLLMRRLRVEHVSIVSVLFVQLLPFVISMLLFQHVSPYFVLPIVLAEAFQFSYCGCMLSLLYDSSSWLVVVLILFLGLFSAPIYLRFWLCKPDYRDRKGRAMVHSTAVMLVLLGVIDYFAISPYWEALLY